MRRQRSDAGRKRSTADRRMITVDLDMRVPQEKELYDYLEQWRSQINPATQRTYTIRELLLPLIFGEHYKTQPSMQNDLFELLDQRFGEVMELIKQIEVTGTKPKSGKQRNLPNQDYLANLAKTFRGE